MYVFLARDLDPDSEISVDDPLLSADITPPRGADVSWRADGLLDGAWILDPSSGAWAQVKRVTLDPGNPDSDEVAVRLALHHYGRRTLPGDHEVTVRVPSPPDGGWTPTYEGDPCGGGHPGGWYLDADEALGIAARCYRCGRALDLTTCACGDHEHDSQARSYCQTGSHRDKMVLVRRQWAEEERHEQEGA